MNKLIVTVDNKTNERGEYRCEINNAIGYGQTQLDALATTLTYLGYEVGRKEGICPSCNGRGISKKVTWL